MVADVRLFRRRLPRRPDDAELAKGEQALNDLRERVEKIKTYRKVVTIRVTPKAD